MIYLDWIMSQQLLQIRVPRQTRSGEAVKRKEAAEPCQDIYIIKFVEAITGNEVEINFIAKKSRTWYQVFVR